MKQFALLVLLGCGVFAGGPGPGADETLKALQAFAKQEKAAAVTAADAAAADERIVAKAKEAVQGLDPGKLDSKDGYLWAQVFRMAKLRPEAETSVARYLASVEGNAKFPAEILLGELYLDDRKPDKASAALISAHPATPEECRSLVAEAIGMVNQVVGSDGADAGLRLLDKVQSLAVLHGGDPSVAAQNEATIYDLSRARADLYQEAARPAEALKALDDGVAILPPTSKSSIRLKTYRSQLTIVGARAPALKIEKGYGDYPGLASWKGKVVVVDFFAHWSKPCKALFPELAKIYADLHPKGLELVGYTTFYGYLGPEKGLSHEEEFAKMDAFITSEGISWPIQFGDRSGFENYGVTGIPYVVLIGKDGNVRDLKLGDNLGGLADFRAELESLLSE